MFNQLFESATLSANTLEYENTMMVRVRVWSSYYSLEIDKDEAAFLS